MTAKSAPYFYSESLKKRFTQSLDEAVGDSQISIHECLWLKRLVNLSNDTLDTLPRPRVDRLIMQDGTPIHGELASALLISDPTRTDAPVFLSTLLFGVERFESRQTLIELLNGRYARSANRPLRLDAELIEDSFFERQMELILQQQAEHLSLLCERLHQLPSLRNVLARSLQERLSESLPQTSINVFKDMSQTLFTPAPSPGTVAAPVVIDAQYLESIVLAEYDALSRSSRRERRFLGPEGQALSPEHALHYVQAITQSLQGLPDSYERFIVDYWNQDIGDGWTMTTFAGYALAESFRQKLLSSRETGALTPFEFRRLRALLPSPSAPPDRDWVHVHRISVSVEGQQPAKLLGVLLVQFTVGSLPGFYMFSVMEGFRRFVDEQAVATHFGTEKGRTELLRYSSLNDHALLSVSGNVQIHLDKIESSLFIEHIGSIIAMQRRNLDYVMKLPFVSHRLATVQIDDALDIRALLDSRLYGFHDSGRWRSGALALEQTWSLDNVPKSLFVDKKFESDFLASWGEQLNGMDDFVQLLGQLHGGVASCVRHSLNRYLAVIGNPALDARRLWAHSAGKAARNLVSLTFESVIKGGKNLWPAGWVLSDSLAPAPASSMSLLPVRLLKHVISLVRRDFIRRYELQLVDFYSRPVRLLDTQAYPGKLSMLIRERTLRLELDIERRRGVIDSQALDMLQQVLDRPPRRLRTIFGNRCVEAYSLSLRLEGVPDAIALTNAFALLDSTPDAQYLMWSLHTGFKVLEPGMDIENLVKDWLVRLDHRDYVLDILSEPDKSTLRQYCENHRLMNIRLELKRIDEHFTHFLETAEKGRQRQKCISLYERARGWGLGPDSLRNALDMAEHDDSKRRIVGRLGVRLQLMQSDELLSKWIREASIDDQIMLLGIWQRFYATHDPDKDFFFEVPDIHEYAQGKLSERLKQDFPEHDLRPDQITITLTNYIGAPSLTGEIPQGIPAATTRVSESLTDFAIDRFSSIQSGTLSVALKEGAPDVLLTAEYIRKLVHSLDVAANYRLLVEQKLDEKAEDYTLRQSYYLEQVPSYELLKAFQYKLMGFLTIQGYDAIESVMTMPDGIARVPFNGKDITISPLQLLRAEAGWAPDNVTGVYVIAPRAPQQGPWLLYSLLSSDFSIKEYADRAELLADILTSSRLQDFILTRLDPSIRHVYASGGFQEPHLPFSTESSMDVPWARPAPANIRTTPFQGNALKLMFKGTLETFKLLIQDDSVSNAESDRASLYYLLGLLSEQVLAFLPGRLGALVGIWQSRSLFQASVYSAVEKQWGKAASEFTAALSMAISSRKKSSEEISEQIDEPEDVLAPEDMSLRFRWGNDALSSDIQARLRQLEVRDVALNDLHKDNLLNTYRDEKSHKEYVAIGGRVYQIESRGGNWCIVGKDRPGPRIKLNTKQQWELDLAVGLKGGGALVSRYRGATAHLDIDKYLVIEARGISEIRRLFRDRCELIKEAHGQAQKYLENALDNLKEHSSDGIDPRAMHIISEFFSTSHPDTHLIGSIRNSLTTLYGALMDPTLSPHDSERYVVGVNRPANHDSLAFVFVEDPMKRIFLTDKFFRLPYYRLKISALRTGEFNLGAHHRGTILLHELSHLCLATEDIAYTDSNAPFLDLLEDTASFRKRLKNEVMSAQQDTLSYRTDRSKLFMQLDDEGGVFKDLKHRDGGAKATVLRLTGKRNLSKARDVFYSDARIRSQVMLSNADSLALLTTLLGRTNFTPLP